MIMVAEGAEHPTTNLTWTENGQLLDLSQGYTFTVSVTSCRDPKKFFTKTTFINGFRNQRPNVQILWQPTSELSTLPIGLYTFQIKANHVTDNTDYVHQDTLMIRPTTP